MDTIIGADAAKLAGLQIDLLHKIRKGQVTLDHLEWFDKLTKGERDQLCKSANIAGPCVIPIDRAKPFEPTKLLDREWTIREQDERSLRLDQIDFAHVRLEHMLKENESMISGERRLRRLKEANYIRLDAKVFQTLSEDKSLIPRGWGQGFGIPISIFFDGTILCRSHGGENLFYVLSLRCREDRWYWDYRWLGGDYRANELSAVIGPA
jgi:hypothetical protein